MSIKIVVQNVVSYPFIKPNHQVHICFINKNHLLDGKQSIMAMNSSWFLHSALDRNNCKRKKVIEAITRWKLYLCRKYLAVYSSRLYYQPTEVQPEIS